MRVGFILHYGHTDDRDWVTWHFQDCNGDMYDINDEFDGYQKSIVNPNIVEWNNYYCYEIHLLAVENMKKYLPKEVVDHIFQHVNYRAFGHWVYMGMPVEVMAKRGIMPVQGSLKTLIEMFHQKSDEDHIYNIPITIATLWCLKAGDIVMPKKFLTKDTIVCNILRWKRDEETPGLDYFASLGLMDKDIFENIIRPMVQYTMPYNVPKRF